MKEFEYIDLSKLEIDWLKFRTELVKFIIEYNGIQKSISLKTYDDTMPLEKQIYQKQTNLNSTTKDPFDDLAYVMNSNIVNNNDIILSEDKFNTWISIVTKKIPYVVESLTEIEKLANLEFSRIRCAILNPKTTTEIHNDFGDTRYHLPIVTNESCFHIVNGEIYSMPSYTKLYKLPCQTWHAAFNASQRFRLHLMFITKEQTNSIHTKDHVDERILEAKHKVKNTLIDPVDKLLNANYYNRILKFF